MRRWNKVPNGHITHPWVSSAWWPRKISLRYWCGHVIESSSRFAKMLLFKTFSGFPRRCKTIYWRLTWKSGRFWLPLASPRLSFSEWRLFRRCFSHSVTGNKRIYYNNMLLDLKGKGHDQSITPKKAKGAGRDWRIWRQAKPTIERKGSTTTWSIKKEERARKKTYNRYYMTVVTLVPTILA